MYVLYVLLLKVDYRIACHRVALIPAQAVGSSVNVRPETLSTSDSESVNNFRTGRCEK
jgi:hypothetical protein